MKPKRLRANQDILGGLKKALRAAKHAADTSPTSRCKVDAQARHEMQLYMNTWVIAPLERVILRMEGDKKLLPEHRYGNGYCDEHVVMPSSARLARAWSLVRYEMKLGASFDDALASAEVFGTLTPEEKTALQQRYEVTSR